MKKKKKKEEEDDDGGGARAWRGGEKEDRIPIDSRGESDTAVSSDADDAIAR